MQNTGEWKGLTIIFIVTSSQLLLSGTYWHRLGIWGVASYRNIRFYTRKKGKQCLRVEQGM